MTSSPPAVLPSRPAPSPLTIEILLGTLIAFGPLSIDMYLPALPTIGRELAASPARVQLTLATFFAGLAVGQLVTGPLLDRFGRQRPLRLGLLLYVAGSLGCGFAPGVGTLAGFRVVQALGGAAVLVVPRTVVRDLRSGVEAARMMSRLVLVMGVAPIVAPLAGGAVLSTLGWRAIFFVQAALALTALGLVLAILPETAPPRRAGVRLRAHLGAILRERDFVAYALTCALAQAGLFAYISDSSFVFITLHGVAPGRFGWFFGANAAAFIVSSQVNRRLLARASPARVLGLALRCSCAAGVLLLGAAATGAGGLWTLAASLFLFMGSLGCVLPNAVALALEHHADRAGLASALLGTLQFTLGAAAAGAVSLAHDGTAMPMAVTIAAAVAMSWLALAVRPRPATT